MSDFLKRSWATVDLDCIGHNIEKVKELVSPGCKVLGVVEIRRLQKDAQET